MGVVSKITAMLIPFARGQNEATRAMIAKALMSTNPVTALAPVIKQMSKTAAGRRAIEAVLRQPAQAKARSYVGGSRE